MNVTSALHYLSEFGLVTFSLSFLISKMGIIIHHRVVRINEIMYAYKALNPVFLSKKYSVIIISILLSL